MFPVTNIIIINSALIDLLFRISVSESSVQDFFSGGIDSRIKTTDFSLSGNEINGADYDQK